MSTKLIPENIDPFRHAEQDLRLDGIVNIADMERLRANLTRHDEQVSVNLHFGVDEQKITFVKGHLETKLELQCQRCMEPFIYEIMSDFVLGLVTTLDEANALPELYEPVLVKDGHLPLRELIEDELILNLPIIPRHEPDQCKVKLPTVEAGWKQEESANPFKVLQSLKDKQQ